MADVGSTVEAVRLKLGLLVADPRGQAALRLAALIDDPDTPAREVSSCSRELRLTLDRLSAEEKVDDDEVDELARRRAARRADSTG